MEIGAEGIMRIFMKENRAGEILQQNIEIPAVVQNKAELALLQIRTESKSDTANVGNAVCKRIRGTAAIVLVTLGTAACAAGLLHWSSGMEAKLNVTQEQKHLLEENGITSSVSKSVSAKGVTITAQQSIVDARFAHLSFRVDGYEVREGSILQPDFEYAAVTVDGADCKILSSGFYHNMHITDKERVYTDGTPIEERSDGSLIERYMNEDGSMEYVISLMIDNKDNSFVGKPIHVTFQNLGTHVRYSSAFRTDIDAAWTLDFTLEGSDKVQSYELSELLGNSGAVVTKAEISPISIYVEYDFPMQIIEREGIDENGNWGMITTYANAPRLTGVRLKDGTLLTGIIAGSTEGYKSDDKNTYTVYGATNHVIDSEEVDALIFIKYMPESAEEMMEIPLEDRIYIVPLK